MDNEERKAVVGFGCVAVLVGVALLAGTSAVIPYMLPLGANGARIDRRAVGSLRTIQSAQTLYREWDKERDGVLDYGTLAELSSATLVDGVLGSGVNSGYCFEVRVSSESPEFLWMAVANPIDRRSGLRSFATNQAGVIHYAHQRLVCNDACRIPARCWPVGK